MARAGEVGLEVSEVGPFSKDKFGLAIHEAGEWFVSTHGQGTDQ